MKKLLITTMAAVSVGLCAKAEGAIDASTFTENDTSFEGLATGNFSFDNNYWSNPTNQDDEFKIIEAVYPDGVTKQHWAWTDGAEKALSIDTANPILRNVNPVSNGNPPLNVSTTPVFFDSVVQFTATDVAPVVDTLNNKEDKLMVWLYQSPDDVSETNPGLFEETTAKKTLVITAGVIEKNGDIENLVQKNYDTGIEINPESWHRLTIKSFLNEKKNKLMFNVWIDGAKDPITAEGVTDFLSMVRPDGDSDIYLQGVAFDGKGVVDDIVFTTTDPLYVPSATYAIVATCNNALVSFSTDEGGEEVLEDVSALPLTTTTVYGYVTVEEGYEVTAAKFNDSDLVVPAIDNSGGYNFLLPIETPKNGDEYAFVVTVTKKADDGDDPGTDEPEEPAKPTVGGNSYETEAALKAVVKSGTEITVPSNWTVDGKVLKDDKGATFATFEYYNLALANGVVTATLDQKAAAPFAEANDLTEGQEVLEVGEDASGNPELTVRIKPYVGLYYGAMTGTSLDNLTLTYDYREATTADVIGFTAKGKAGDTAGFIKVVVTDIAPEATGK